MDLSTGNLDATDPLGFVPYGQSPVIRQPRSVITSGNERQDAAGDRKGSFDGLTDDRGRPALHVDGQRSPGDPEFSGGSRGLPDAQVPGKLRITIGGRVRKSGVPAVMNVKGGFG